VVPSGYKLGPAWAAVVAVESLLGIKWGLRGLQWWRGYKMVPGWVAVVAVRSLLGINWAWVGGSGGSGVPAGY